MRQHVLCLGRDESLRPVHAEARGWAAPGLQPTGLKALSEALPFESAAPAATLRRERTYLLCSVEVSKMTAPFHMEIKTLPDETIVVSGVSNREFLEQFARPGRIGLSGGITLVDKAICRAERHLDSEARWSTWSHAFLFQGQRQDGHHWIIESDLQIHRKHIQLGVQENRIAKYFDENLYTTLAVLDFGLKEEQIGCLLREALELVASRARYSLRELVGTLVALKHPELRGQDNVLARQSSMYCSAFVHYLFRKAAVDLAPGVDDKNTTPEDIFRTRVLHRRWLLQRELPPGKLGQLRAKLRSRVKGGIEELRKRRGKSGS